MVNTAKGAGLIGKAFGFLAKNWKAVGIGSAAVGGVYTCAKMRDPDFVNAMMMNRMTGKGGFLHTMFYDGARSWMVGSRSMSAMMPSGFWPGAMGNPMMMSMMSPYAFGMQDPYMMSMINPAMMRMPWGMC